MRKRFSEPDNANCNAPSPGRLGTFLRSMRFRVAPRVTRLGAYERSPIRFGRRITQEELAEALGVTREWYSLLECGGRTRASPRLLARIAETLMLSLREQSELFAIAIPEARAPSLESMSLETVHTLPIGAVADGARLDGPRLDQPTQKFVDELLAAGDPPIETLSPAEARKVLENMQSMPVTKEPADITEHTVPGGPTGDVSIRVVRPHDTRDVLPAIIFIHSGGWIFGDAETHDRLVREIANGARAAVIFVNYSRSPEARFPVAIEQIFAAAKYIADHGRGLNVDGRRMAIAGGSVGGDMTAAVTILAKERGEPKFRFQAMFYPVTDAGCNTSSYKAFANGPWLTERAMRCFWDAYVPNVAERAKPTASPLRATLDQLRGLPPALVITDDNDVLRDEGEAYALKLMQAGVQVTAFRALGTIHDFMVLNGLADTPAARESIALVNQKLRTALAA
jgi:acetyl esterase